MGSLPFLLSFRMRLPSGRLMPARAVTRSVVITSLSFFLRSVSKSMSRAETMPTRRPPGLPSSVIGTPVKP